jgi:hypothetical protein
MSGVLIALVVVAATEARFNTDYNGAPAARP